MENEAMFCKADLKMGDIVITTTGERFIAYVNVASPELGIKQKKYLLNDRHRFVLDHWNDDFTKADGHVAAVGDIHHILRHGDLMFQQTKRSPVIKTIDDLRHGDVITTITDKTLVVYKSKDNNCYFRKDGMASQHLYADGLVNYDLTDKVTGIAEIRRPGDNGLECIWKRPGTKTSPEAFIVSVPYLDNTGSGNLFLADITSRPETRDKFAVKFADAEWFPGGVDSENYGKVYDIFRGTNQLATFHFFKAGRSGDYFLPHYGASSSKTIMFDAQGEAVVATWSEDESETNNTKQQSKDCSVWYALGLYIDDLPGCYVSVFREGKLVETIDQYNGGNILPTSSLHQALKFKHEDLTSTTGVAFLTTLKTRLSSEEYLNKTIRINAVKLQATNEPSEIEQFFQFELARVHRIMYFTVSTPSRIHLDNRAAYVSMFTNGEVRQTTTSVTGAAKFEGDETSTSFKEINAYFQSLVNSPYYPNKSIEIDYNFTTADYGHLKQFDSSHVLHHKHSIVYNRTVEEGQPISPVQPTKSYKFVFRVDPNIQMPNCKRRYYAMDDPADIPVGELTIEAKGLLGAITAFNQQISPFGVLQSSILSINDVEYRHVVHYLTELDMPITSARQKYHSVLHRIVEMF